MHACSGRLLGHAVHQVLAHVARKFPIRVALGVPWRGPPQCSCSKRLNHMPGTHGFTPWTSWYRRISLPCSCCSCLQWDAAGLTSSLLLGWPCPAASSCTALSMAAGMGPAGADGGAGKAGSVLGCGADAEACLTDLAWLLSVTRALLASGGSTPEADACGSGAEPGDASRRSR